MDNNVEQQKNSLSLVPPENAIPIQGRAGDASKVGLTALAVAGALFASFFAWDHLGSTQLQRIGADKACVQVMQQADMEVHNFKSGYPAGIGDISNGHTKISAEFLCGDALRSVEQWDDARGARLADGSVVQTRSIDDPGTFDLLSWRMERARSVAPSGPRPSAPGM